MDKHIGPARDLASVTQRIQNLTYVLALNADHGAALVSLRGAIEDAAAEGRRRSSQSLLEVVAVLRRLTERWADRQDVDELSGAAALFYEVTIRVTGMPEDTHGKVAGTGQGTDGDA